MYARPFHSELALAGMRVLAQIISVSSCARNWSAHGHIQSEVRNRRAPATTEKPVYIYSNRKAVASTACDDTLKMYAWDNERCAASRASAARRFCTRSSCLCTRAQHPSHSSSSRMSSRAASRAVCAPARRAHAHSDTARARRVASERDSSMPAVSSAIFCLSKMGQAGQPGFVTHGRGPERSGAQGAGH